MSEGPVGDEGRAVARERRMPSLMGRIFHMRDENEKAAPSRTERVLAHGAHGKRVPSHTRKGVPLHTDWVQSASRKCEGGTFGAVAHEKEVHSSTMRIQGIRVQISAATVPSRAEKMRHRRALKSYVGNKRHSRVREDALSHMEKDSAVTHDRVGRCYHGKGIVAHEKESFIAHKEEIPSHTSKRRKSDVKGAVVHDRGGANVHEKGVIALSGMPWREKRRRGVREMQMR
ncbi:hypothetical protein B0H13DRAFT_1873163 [Mycena leptocephala]|nr:hypothetical protein B0H13DRAFT_1873163 [Mycena leptocephala]